MVADATWGMVQMRVTRDRRTKRNEPERKSH